MSEVYGTYKILEDCRDKLKAQFDALITAMASGYDPKISYAYGHHAPARLQLNGATIGIDVANSNDMGKVPSGILTGYVIDCSIRVHTAYQGGYIDNVKICRLLNSVDNWFHTHIDLADSYQITNIDNIKTNLVFDDSKTIGGELRVTIKLAIDHIQV